MNIPENENDDPVWDLLKKAPPTKPGPFFSRNVVREVRKMEAEQPTSFLIALAWHSVARFFSSPTKAWGALASCSAMAVIVAVVLMSDSPTTSPDAVAANPETPGASAPAETIGGVYDPANEIGNLDYLGELMAVTDPSMLDDHALADLLF